MTELDALLPLWVQSPDADLRGVVADILTELAAAVADHLDVVEETVLPAVDRHFTPGEWLTLRAARRELDPAEPDGMDARRHARGRHRRPNART